MTLTRIYSQAAGLHCSKGETDRGDPFSFWENKSRFAIDPYP